MMNRIVAITVMFIVGSLLCGIKTDAQSFLWHLKKTENGKGTITIHQDKSLDYIIDNREPVKDIVKADTVARTHKDVMKPKVDTIRVRPKAPDIVVKRKMISKGDSTHAIVPTKKIITNGRKIPGYRIQLYAGGNTRQDRQKAEMIGRKMKLYFPSEPIYTHFYSPRWICRMGNYESMDKATQVLNRVHKLGVPGACIVKGMITVRKVKETTEDDE
ncbi:MAG: SPOR domain-containing protein [Prevotella sp.]|nr:SPOR domain-containing protein [Candidatus Equicola stercoris]